MLKWIQLKGMLVSEPIRSLTLVWGWINEQTKFNINYVLKLNCRDEQQRGEAN